ncbi:hypothetical protein OXX69_000675 [Metschnikowia pulcherrima]
MTGVSNAQGTRGAHSSKFKPRFHNPDPLPSVSEFRLDHILAKALHQESTQVCESLMKVSDNYQQDLKREIRKALAIEQKIQNKNIHAIKRAHKLTKQWQNTRKEFSRNMNSASENRKNCKVNKRGNTALGSDIDSLLTQSIDVSSNVKSLAVRMAQLSRKRGGNGKPDQAKCPNLNRLLNSLDPPDSLDPNQMQNEPNGTKLDVPLKGSLPQEWRENGMEEAAPKNEHTGSVKGVKEEERGPFADSPDGNSQPFPRADIHVGTSQALSQKDASQNSPKAHIGNALQAMRNKDNRESDFLEGSSSAGHKNRNSGPVNDDTLMDTDAFELFMDTSIAKYRERKDERSRSLSSFSLEKNGSLRKSARNPLRLLSSGSLASGHSIKSSPYIEQDDPLKYSFLPRKSAATVLETPEMSLHKKLRIKVLPSPAKSPKDDACICQQTDPEISSEQDELAKSGEPSDTNKTLNITEDAAKTQNPNEDVWSSSEAPTEAESSSDNSMASSSSDESSSDSNDGHISETNSYYVSLRSQMKRKSRKKQKNTTDLAYLKEPSPSRKHQPSHRVLQPKQSILKLGKAKTSNSGARAEIADIVNNEESQYMASPRASFVNENSVVGMILHVSEDTGKSPKDDTSEGSDGRKSDQKFSRGSIDSASPNQPSSSEGKEDMSQAMGKLRSLII